MVKFSEWITEAFHMVKSQLGPWMVVTLVFMLISVLASFTIIGIFVIAGIMMFGLHAVALKQLRGGEVNVGGMTSTFRLFAPGLAYWGIWLLVATVSILLLFIPLIFIAPLWVFVPHLILDKQMGVIEAMKESARVVKQDYWMFFLFNLVIGFLASIGTYICYVGMLATLPFMFCALAVAYRDCFQIEGAYSFMPAKD